MRTAFLVLASLACAGQGRRLTSAFTLNSPLKTHQSLPEVVDGKHNPKELQQKLNNGFGRVNPSNSFAKFLLTSSPASGWQTLCAPHRLAVSKAARAQCDMMAKGPEKQKAKVRKRVVKKDRSRFNIVRALPSNPVVDTEAALANIRNRSKELDGKVVTIYEDDDDNLEMSLEQMLQDDGLIQQEYREDPESAKKGDLLSKLPQSGQEQLEKVWIGGAVIFGSIFILACVLVSSLAVFKFLKVSGEFYTSYDYFLTKFINPIILPCLVITFFNTISLGILKSFQLQSEGAGILYTEDDDPFKGMEEKDPFKNR